MVLYGFKSVRDAFSAYLTKKDDPDHLEYHYHPTLDPDARAKFHQLAASAETSKMVLTATTTPGEALGPCSSPIPNMVHVHSHQPISVDYGERFNSFAVNGIP